MLITELHTHQIPEVYRQFAAAVGDKHWKHRVQQCKQVTKGNPFIREYLEQENAIAYQLCHLGELIDRFGTLSPESNDLRNFYPAASFAAQALSLMAISKDDSQKLRRRIQGALKNPDDMRGLRMEFSAATHFVRRGKRISWAESYGLGTFDILVEGDAHPPLEVECKSIADAKGQKIHTKDVLEFFALLKPYLWPYAKGLTTGLSVVLTVPGRLPTAYNERVALAKELSRAVVTGSGTLADGSILRISEFDVGQLGAAPDRRHPRELRQTIDGVTGTNNRHAALIGFPAGGALAFAVQSLRDDSLLKATFDTLSDAASRQLTGTRAGLLWVGFDGLDGEELVSIALQDKDAAQPTTALRIAVSQFLSSPAREHVVGVGFVSRSGLQPAQHGLVESGGTAYYFPKPESPFWSNSFSGMFALSTDGTTARA